MFFFFFFNDTATTEIYTLSLHDALPICCRLRRRYRRGSSRSAAPAPGNAAPSRSPRDRKSTRLNSSHLGISYAVFCLKKKNTPDEENELASNIGTGVLHGEICVGLTPVR